MNNSILKRSSTAILLENIVSSENAIEEFLEIHYYQTILGTTLITTCLYILYFVSNYVYLKTMDI